MPRGIQKEHLPSKVCIICLRPFTWRKKWETVWDEVTTCSKSCNAKRRALNQQSKKEERMMIMGTATTISTACPLTVVEDITKKNQCLRVNHPAGWKLNHSNDVVVSTETSTLDAQESSTFVPEMVFNLANNGLATLTKNDVTGMAGVIDKSWESMARTGSHAISSSNDNINNNNNNNNNCERHSDDDSLDAKTARKFAKKHAKAERRARREGRADPSYGQKQCDVCSNSVDLLIRCTIDESKTWKMVCGRCWHTVSGGVVDGDANHPHYRYGGVWKNRAKR